MVAGKYQDAVEAERPQLAGDPSVVDFLNLAASYTGLNRFDEEAQEGAINDSFARKLDDPVMHENLYTLDFLRGDTANLEHELALSARKPGWEDLDLFLHSNTAAFHGRINDARSLPGVPPTPRTAPISRNLQRHYGSPMLLCAKPHFGNRDQLHQFATGIWENRPKQPRRSDFDSSCTCARRRRLAR